MQERPPTIVCAYCALRKTRTDCCDSTTLLPWDSRVWSHGRPKRYACGEGYTPAAAPVEEEPTQAPRRVERPVNGAQSKRKPYNGDAGYHCSLKTPFGHVVLYDRRNGGDWIDGGERWVLAAYDRGGSNLALLDCRTERWGRRAMKDTRDGWTEWIEWDAIRATFPDADVPRSFLEGANG